MSVNYLLDTNICSAYMGTIRAKILAGISDLLNEAAVVPFCPACAEEFGKLRGDLKRRGIAASPLDLQIAAVARVHDFCLVTNNTKDFQNIPGLRLEDWLTS